ncbi:uncharacterized protein A1O5_01292 [Cladophialophora psammophila CBS 110553]|uniref:Nephrocystin 3-like N-terminal domain-containing protein n=1 Tax=Cladophialophora psammophila CBS 110553 TaxID=1182543 RepID=W9Y2T9_9EURO|nr:uncharacterized protein A1O5_01292 [Cladophialophora psammophila CBS 110553]EXJ76784.1 hypothetical protein A1O5_01292 [Cladophialophora psammophila CBS 110553]
MSTLIARLRAASTRSLTRWCSDVADPEEGTFEWILKRPAFLTLLQPDSSGILHILGKPGCGKTVLAKHIYYKFDAFTGPATKYPVGKTLLFACDAAVDGSRAAINILTSLMTQMLEFQEESKEPLEPPLSSLALEETWSFHQLAEAFSGLITGLWPHILGTRKYAIVIDGLDECDSGSERDALLELFSKVAGASQGGTTPVAIVATSRPYAEISFSGGYTNILDLNTEKAMDQDLATYIRHGVANLVSKRPKLAAYQQVIVDKLENRADKMYLLIRLLLEVLLHMIDSSPYSIDSILVSLPETLSDIYDQIWSRVASAEEGRARMIFSWLLCAIRPFTLIELGIAIATYDYNKWHQQHEGTKFRLNIAGHETTRHIQDKNGLLTKIPPFHRARFEGYIPFMPLDLEGDLNRLFGPLVKISRSHKLSREGSEHEDSTTEESRNTEEGHTNVTHVNLVHSPTVDRMPWFRAKQNGDSTAAWPSSPEGWYEIDERKALDVIRRTERLLGPYSTSKGRDYSTKDLEPKVTLCHQTVQEHFSSKPGFLDEPGTHLQLAELCARTRDGTVTGDSDTESIDTLDEATATQPDDSRDYSEYWRDHRLMAVMLDPWLNGKVRLRRRRTAPSKLVIRQRESDYNF